MDYIQIVDIIFLGLGKNYIIMLGYLGMKWMHTECPNACSHSFIPTKLGVPFTVELPLGVAESGAVAGAAGVLGRAFRLRVSRSLKAFYTVVRLNL